MRQVLKQRSHNLPDKLSPSHLAHRCGVTKPESVRKMNYSIRFAPFASLYFPFTLSKSCDLCTHLYRDALLLPQILHPEKCISSYVLFLSASCKHVSREHPDLFSFVNIHSNQHENFKFILLQIVGRSNKIHLWSTGLLPESTSRTVILNLEKNF